MFYFLIVLLTVLAIALVWFAFKARTTNPEQLIHQRLSRHVQLFNSNIKQLESDREEGLIEQDTFQSLYNEQARDLLETAQKLEATDTATSPLKGASVCAFAGMIVLALSLYHAKGAYPDYIINHELKKLSDVTSPEAYSAALFTLKDTIEARVEQRPDSIEYRLLLAQLAMSKEDYTGALSHYSVVAELLPEDAQAQAYYAQALYLANNRRLDANVSAALDKTLQLDPFQATALGMVGILAFESGDFQSAIDAWQKLMAVTDPSSQRGQMIQKGIANAEQALNGSSEPTVKSETAMIASASEQETAAQAPELQGIQLGLSISQALRQSLQQNYSVFVYAKAENGPPMPLAVRRLRLSDLPLQVNLDDSTAMTPQFKLSNFDRVIVGARISKSGNAIAQQGDITVELPGFNWRDNTRQSLQLDQ